MPPSSLTRLPRLPRSEDVKVLVSDLELRHGGQGDLGSPAPPGVPPACEAQPSDFSVLV